MHSLMRIDTHEVTGAWKSNEKVCIRLPTHHFYAFTASKTEEILHHQLFLALLSASTLFCKQNHQVQKDEEK